MGDRFATIDMGRKDGAAVSLSGGGVLGPHLPQCGLWAEVYLRTKWHLDLSSRLATINICRKLRAVPLFTGELGPHLTANPSVTAWHWIKMKLGLPYSTGRT